MSRSYGSDTGISLSSPASCCQRRCWSSPSTLARFEALEITVFLISSLESGVKSHFGAEMLKAPTVFVLGAGAGFDVGMPLGDTLSDQIAAKLDIRFDANHLVSGQPDIVESLRRYARERGEPLTEYRQSAVQIKKGVHYSRSIDSFINSRRDDKKLAVCAKLGIIHTILEHERRSALNRKSGRENFHDETKVRQSWLPDFFNLLISDIYVQENLSAIFSNLTIINFNYDRCIEQFLYYALADWAQKSQGVIEGLMRSLRIYHPYGVVGEPLWSADRNKPKEAFGGEEHDDHLDRLVESIKTFHEQVEEGEELAKMREALVAADRIIYLGFHFHKPNMDLMQVGERKQRGHLPRAFATVKNRSGEDIALIIDRIKKSTHLENAGNVVFTVNGGCKELFREYEARWIR
jgi:hypothetical protein